MANGGSHLAVPARQSPGACDGRRGQSWAAERGSGQRPEAGEGGFDDSTSMAGGGSCRCLADAVSTAATIQAQSSWQEVNAIVLAVGHDEFKAMGARKIRRWGKKAHMLYDVKYLFSSDQTDGRL